MKLEKYKNPSSEVFRLIQDLEEVKKIDTPSCL